jgi:hypothetical protein
MTMLHCAECGNYLPPAPIEVADPPTRHAALCSEPCLIAWRRRRWCAESVGVFRIARYLTLLLVLLGLVLAPAPSAASADQATAFWLVLNAYRAQHAIAPLDRDARLDSAAAERAAYLLAHCPTVCNHDEFAPTLTRSGYAGGAGENLAWGAGLDTAAAALGAWQASKDGHNENMLNPGWKAVGVSQACVGWVCAWVTDFGDRPSGSSAPRPSPTPTATLAPCPLTADLNADGRVDTLDLSRFAVEFDRAGAGIAADLNRDGRVDVFDLTVLAAEFGQPCRY